MFACDTGGGAFYYSTVLGLDAICWYEALFSDGKFMVAVGAPVRGDLQTFAMGDAEWLQMLARADRTRKRAANAKHRLRRRRERRLVVNASRLMQLSCNVLRGAQVLDER